MAKKMNLIALLSIIITTFFIAMYINSQSGLLLTLSITFLTITYHFNMRLLVGFIVNTIFKNHMNYYSLWFTVSDFEQKLYKKLNIKKQKSTIATYDPNTFDNSIHTWDEIAQATCQAELVHEIIIILSFVPILLSIRYGEFFIFLITSILAACFDLKFVIVQRFNRPRILKLITISNRKKGDL